MLTFWVTFDRAYWAPVTVRYTTADGTAKVGADYEAVAYSTGTGTGCVLSLS